MRKRLAVVTAGLLMGLMALGTANALVLDTAPGTETVASETAVAGTETVYEVGDAGTVTITNDGTQLEIVSVDQNDGWLIEIEMATGREVEVDFRSGTRRIQFNAELEDGEIRVRARERVVAATTNTTQSTTATTQATTATTAATVASTSASGSVTYQAGAAGTVTISNDGSQLTITAVDAADGWSHEIEVQVGREVEMDFRNGGDRVQFNAELEDGQVRIRVRTRTADGTRTEVTNGVDTTDDDNSDDDDSSFDDDADSDDDDSNDNSGRGNSDDDSHSDDDDNSGQGSSDSDDHDSDDDNSGHGGSDSDDDDDDDSSDD